MRKFSQINENKINESELESVLDESGFDYEIINDYYYTNKAFDKDIQSLSKESKYSKVIVIRPDIRKGYLNIGGWDKKPMNFNSSGFYPFDDLEDAQNKYNKVNLSNININSCLANKYRTGVDHIKPHRDSNYSFGNEPTVLIYSIGATRKLTFTNNKTKKQFSYDLEDGSLFIMNGRSQEDYTHEVPPSDTKDVRYSLTFREYIQ